MVKLIMANCGIKWNAKKWFRAVLSTAKPLIHSTEDFPNYRMAENGSVTTVALQNLICTYGKTKPTNAVALRRMNVITPKFLRMKISILSVSCFGNFPWRSCLNQYKHA